MFFGMIIMLNIVCLISCYKGYGLSPTGTVAEEASMIRGTISFENAWPDSTREVRVIVSKYYPEGITDIDSLYNFVVNGVFAGEITLGDTLPKFLSSVDYQVNLKPGNYEWVLVVWFPNIANYLLGAKELGAYYEEDGLSDKPAPVYVRPGGTVEGIDITADLNHVYNERPFFKR